MVHTRKERINANTSEINSHHFLKNHCRDHGNFISIRVQFHIIYIYIYIFIYVYVYIYIYYFLFIRLIALS